MDAPATYLQWGPLLISVPNLLVIAGMIVVFLVALLAPFPHQEAGPDAPDEERHD